MGSILLLSAQLANNPSTAKAGNAPLHVWHRLSCAQCCVHISVRQLTAANQFRSAAASATGSLAAMAFTIRHALP